MPTKFVKGLPPASRGSYQRTPKPEHQKIADSLRKRPKVWAEISEHPTVSSARAFGQSIRGGKNLAFTPPGTFEATTRGNKVWCRYIGG